jgi:aspartate-semialdehyde dehydrogenase
MRLALDKTHNKVSRYLGGTVKKKVAILGATGRVGQTFSSLLRDHPIFEVAQLCGSERNYGKSYAEALGISELRGDKLGELKLSHWSEQKEVDLYLSALSQEAASIIELELRKYGAKIISNAGAFRLDVEVPVVVPEVNKDHFYLFEQQLNKYGGAILCQSNCCVSPLSLALAPLKKWGIECVNVVTLQAISGAGVGFDSSLVEDSVISWIADEEEKIQNETPKVLGKLTNQGKEEYRVEPYPMWISAQVNRIPVSHGHTLNIHVKLKERLNIKELKKNYYSFSESNFPFSPLVLEENPKKLNLKQVRELGHGMSVTLGRLKLVSPYEVKMVAMSHNMIRGAAGGALLCAQKLHEQGLL